MGTKVSNRLKPPYGHVLFLLQKAPGEGFPPSVQLIWKEWATARRGLAFGAAEGLITPASPEDVEKMEGWLGPEFRTVAEVEWVVCRVPAEELGIVSVFVFIPKTSVIDWRIDWLLKNDPHDGGDCVTPFDGFLYGGCSFPTQSWREL